MRPDDKVGNLPGLHGGHPFVGRQSDKEDLPHDGCQWTHQRAEAAWKVFTHERQPLGYELPRSIDIDPPVELHEYDRKPDARGGAHADDARHSIHGVFNWKSDDLFHFLWSQSLGFRQQRDCRPVEIGKHIDRNERQRDRAIHNEYERRREDKQAVPEAARNQNSEHCGAPR